MANIDMFFSAMSVKSIAMDNGHGNLKLNVYVVSHDHKSDGLDSWWNLVFESGITCRFAKRIAVVEVQSG